ncbi:LacI family transcriptional regulator [Occultella glacieicola]|uniref:LacI family transcriptional regulator n=1 Tax=Occultella glacieicola TaxID=2518684 RepID=A0ABY2DYM1_9MICO|nr:LacI family DNA-binding transcriptional regulator [Occultella glacieicola]TDE89578.1 LacI family transcriptional regulator [Occultella glacieicola]
MANQKEIARRAGVSVSVVSAVVNGTSHTRMSDETRAKVEAVIAAVGYVPNDAARALRLQRSGTIAVVLDKLDNPVYHELIHGLYEAAEERGWAVVLGDTNWMRSGSQFLARLLGLGSIDGIVLRQEHLIDERVMAMLTQRRTPVVLLGGRDEPEGRWLSIDDFEAGRVAAGHLIELGHRDVGYVGGRWGISTDERYRGYREAMVAAGLQPRPPLKSGYGLEGGAAGMAELLAGPHLPTGLVVNNVMAAVGLVGVARDAGIAMPERLSVIGLHDADVAAHARPSLTTVRLPMDRLGALAIEQIALLLDGGQPRFGVIHDPAPEIIVRGSTAPPSH